MDVGYHVDHRAGEEWLLPDLTASYLSLDRDVCRRAFFREPVEAVSEAVRSVLAGKDAPGYDPEGAITRWARERGAGVFGEGRRRDRGGLGHVGAVADGLLLGLAGARPRLDPASEYHLYLACARAEERRLGRQMTPSELDRFERRFHATGHRQNLETVPPGGWDELEAELERATGGTQRPSPGR